MRMLSYYAEPVSDLPAQVVVGMDIVKAAELLEALRGVDSPIVAELYAAMAVQVTR